VRRNIAAFSEIDHDMVQRVWSEMDYRVVVCCVTKGRHTQLLGGMQKIWRIYNSICSSHITIFSSIQVYRFCEICQGILNPVDSP